MMVEQLNERKDVSYLRVCMCMGVHALWALLSDFAGREDMEFAYQKRDFSEGLQNFFK